MTLYPIRMMVKSFVVSIFLIGGFSLLSNPSGLIAQPTTQQGSLMGWVHHHISNDMPIENSEGFVKPSSSDLSHFRSIFDLLLAESYNQIDDSLDLYFPSYEFIELTDTTFENQVYHVIRENPVTKGWGTFVYNSNWQRNVTIGIPHPLFDSKTPYEGIDFLQYLGARFFVMSGTHRCANAEESSCDGTTSACSGGDLEPFKVSDMAHNDSTVFQIAHEAMNNFSATAWFLNVHGHNSSSCEDVFLSNGRIDDPSSELLALKDSLLANGVNAAYAGDGSACSLTGTTNTQGRLVNGSSDPCGSQNVSNTGRFFHIEQATSIRASQDKYRALFEELAEMIPRTLNTINFPAFKELTINELHMYPISPGGNANGLSGVQTISDEFVEMVNTDTNTFDLSGWSISDNTDVRHVFPSGTKLVKGQALVVFGGSFTGDFKGAMVQTASTATLNLNNSSESVFINAPTGAPIFSVNYDTSGTFFSGGSLVRVPELTGNFTWHKSADVQNQTWFSPGYQLDGNAFVPYITMTNLAGWRMLSAPVENFPIENLSAFTAIQGIENGYSANLYTSYSGTDWVKPNTMSDSLEAGNGFITYFFNNNNAGSSELPITLRASGSIPNTDVTINLHTNGNKFNLIGNPFNSTIDWSQIQVNSGALTSSVGHIWDPESGDYITTTALSDKVAAWQGLMVQNNTAPSITIPLNAQTSGGLIANGDLLFKKPTIERDVYHLVFEHKQGEKISKNHLVIVFDENAQIGLDELEAEKLWPLSYSDKLFAFTSEELYQNENGFAQSSFPVNQDKLELDIKELGNFTGDFNVSIKKLSQSSSHHRMFTLVDIQHDSTVHFVENEVFTFKGMAFQSKINDSQKMLTVQNNGITRFKLQSLLINQTSNQESQSIPNQFKVYQNFPNPFNPTTNIKYEVSFSGNVSISIYSVLGEFIVQLENEFKTPGQYELQFDASNLSSGIYFYKVDSKYGSKIMKMMLIK